MPGNSPNSGNVSGGGGGEVNIGPFKFRINVSGERDVGGGTAQQQQQAAAQAPKMGLATLLPLAGIAAIIFSGKK